jgi:hypothetical protein
MQKEHRAFETLRQAVTTVASIWRGRQARILAKQIMLANALQSVVRMRQQRDYFAQQRQVAFVAQSLVAAQNARREAAEHRTARVLQQACRGALARWFFKRANGAAICIQRIWKGYQTRCLIPGLREERMREIRARLEEAERSANEAKRIGNRTRAAVYALQGAANLTVAMRACLTLGTLSLAHSRYVSFADQTWQTCPLVSLRGAARVCWRKAPFL